MRALVTATRGTATGETGGVALGGAAAALMAVAILVSTFGCNNGLILAGPRVYWAMARDRLFFGRAGELHPEIPTKSGLMLGLGETQAELAQALADLHAAGVRLLTLGQYLQPSAAHLPVERWVTPEEFDAWAAHARALGFRQVAAGPLVRSSYHAEQLAGRIA